MVNKVVVVTKGEDAAQPSGSRTQGTNDSTSDLTVNQNVQVPGQITNMVLEFHKTMCDNLQEDLKAPNGSHKYTVPSNAILSVMLVEKDKQIRILERYRFKDAGQVVENQSTMPPPPPPSHLQKNVRQINKTNN